ncbi:MAG: hypothetical protein OXG46_09980 [Chloroflexi bacterium]|nr:hypothetical protein [Chloroflexota bacterium]
MEIELNEGVTVKLAGRYVRTVSWGSKYKPVHLALPEATDRNRKIKVLCGFDIPLENLVAYARLFEAGGGSRCTRGCFNQD